MTSVAIPGPLSLGELLDRAFRLYRAYLWPLLLTAGILLVPVGLVSGLVTGQFTTSFMRWAEVAGRGSEPDAVEFLPQFFGLAGAIGFQTIVVAVVTAWAMLALTSLDVAALHGRQPSLGATLRAGLCRLLPYIGMVILQAFAIVVAVMAVIVPMVLLIALAEPILGGIDGGPLVSIALVLLVLIGSLLMLVLIIVPAIYLLARWIAAAPSLVAEDLGPIAALRRSWRLTRGQVWRSIGYLVLLGLLSYVVTSMPSMVLQQSLTLALGPGGLGWALGLSMAFTQILAILWLPLQIAATVLLYYDLRVRQEGYDLALRVAQLEESVRSSRIGDTDNEAPAPSEPVNRDDV